MTTLSLLHTRARGLKSLKFKFLQRGTGTWYSSCFKFSHFELNLSLSELCTGLPSEILNLTTVNTFPVSYNTAVTVSCLVDGKLRGDNVITCNQDTKFLFEVKPRCNDIGL